MEPKGGNRGGDGENICLSVLFSAVPLRGGRYPRPPWGQPTHPPPPHQASHLHQWWKVRNDHPCRPFSCLLCPYPVQRGLVACLPWSLPMWCLYSSLFLYLCAFLLALALFHRLWTGFRLLFTIIVVLESFLAVFLQFYASSCISSSFIDNFRSFMGANIGFLPVPFTFSDTKKLTFVHVCRVDWPPHSPSHHSHSHLSDFII